MALFLVVVATYSPTLTADFVNWDDPGNILDNPRVTERARVLENWTSTENPEFLPLTYTTFWVEWQLSDGAPWLFHLDNVLMHAGNALLVALLGQTIGLPMTASYLVAALWALHPVQVASVAWITERKNVLYVLLWLASLLSFIRAADVPSEDTDRRAARASSRTPLLYSLSVLCFILAILSKRAAITLPAAIALVQWARHRLDRRTWVWLAPYAAVALVGGVTLLMRVPTELAGPPLPLRLIVACRALWFYVLSFFWPVGLVPIYPRWSPNDVTPVAMLAVAAVLVGALVVFALRRRLSRAAMLGIALFLLNAAMVIGIVWFTFFRFALVADHLAYLPLLGLALATVAGLRQLAPMVRVSEQTLMVALGLCCTLLAAASWRNIGVWHDSATLWATTLAKNPACAACEVNLGMLVVDDDPAAAAEHFERALALEADAVTMRRLGYARALQGRDVDAEAAYRRALRTTPNDADSHYGLANALRRQDKNEEAIKEYRETLRLNPRAVDARHNLGIALVGVGRPAEAQAELEQALRLRPRDLDAELALAAVAGERGDHEGEERWYATALQHTSDQAAGAMIHSRFAQALLARGDMEQAATHFEAALRLDPHDAEMVESLADVLSAAGKQAQAIDVLRAGLTRIPDDPSLAGALAWRRATSHDPQWRDGSEAVRLAEHACRATSNGDADLLDTLAAAYAEVGRYQDAVRTAERALEVGGDDWETAADTRERLTLYRAGRPFHQP